MKNYSIFLFTPILLISCAPTVSIQTPEPLQINIAMEVDVTTQSKESQGATKVTESDEANISPTESRRLRIGEIQNLKNNRVVGEANNGLLVIKATPQDQKFAEYTQKIVNEENEDRLNVFQGNVEDRGQPLEVIRREFAKRARDASFPGEWIQLPESDGGEWKKK